ncbi:MAG: hypothetical protein EOP21_14870 [Hyphomicrobiales bacterium]|nr:MAG: hypothetical protein EOP21_14870 [Hyphomicrobiales bacterium]
MVATVASAERPREVDVSQLDVAGVRLGMTPAEAREALNAAGYSVSDDSTYLSWKARVAEEAGKYANVPKDTTRAVVATGAEGPENQKIEVRYAVGPNGSRVDRVKYRRLGRQGNIFPMAFAKYAQPTAQGSSTASWCSQRKGCPTQIFEPSRLAWLSVYQVGDGNASITLDQGLDAAARLKAIFDAAVRAIAPSYGRASC